MVTSFIALNRIAEETANRDAEYGRTLAQNGKPLLSQVRKLSDEELIAKLGEVGIGLDKVSYAEIAEFAISAEEIFNRVTTAEVRSKFKATFDADWVWLALTVLWERWFPQWPNFEQLDERIQAGYELLESDPSGACEQWTQAWKDFLLLCDKGSIGGIAEFDDAFRGTQFVSNWTSDFEMALGNAAVKDHRWHERLAEFCEEFLRRFPHEDVLTRENMRRALGEATFGIGGPARGDALFERFLKEDPQWGWGWIGWADCYSFERGGNLDLQRAEALLRRALDVHGLRDREDLIERLADLCERQGRVEEARRFKSERERFRHVQTGSNEFPSEDSRGPSAPPAPMRSEKIGRNEPCPCGSGKKYKKCCLPKDEERARQAAAAQRQQALPGGGLATGYESAQDAKVETGQNEPLAEEGETGRATEADAKLDRLWDEFEKLARPTVVQMDDFLSQLLSFSAEVTEWSDVIHRFRRLEHPDLPGVFRRIAAAVPHTKEAGMSFFYWAAAEEFAGQGAMHLLPEVTEGFRRLDLESYDPDALSHLEDCLLAEGLDAQTLRLAEHFLPIERADDDLMYFAVPHRCGLIFELRVGQALRDGPSAHASPDALAKQLRSDIEKEIHENSARVAAGIAAGATSDPPWERSQFELVTGDFSEDDEAWREWLRLFGTNIRVAREAWLIDKRPPGCALRGLTLLLNSVCDWKKPRGEKPGKSSNNLLDYLRPSGLEERVARSCRGIIGVKGPKARLILDAHELLAHCVARHGLITATACAENDKELARLRRKLKPEGSERL